MIVSHGIDSSMVHRRQCSFWESSRFDCSEAACRIRPFGVDSGRPLACHFANHDTEAHRPVERKLRKAAVYWGSRGDTQGTADTNLLILA